MIYKYVKALYWGFWRKSVRDVRLAGDFQLFPTFNGDSISYDLRATIARKNEVDANERSMGLKNVSGIDFDVIV